MDPAAVGAKRKALLGRNAQVSQNGFGYVTVSGVPSSRTTGGTWNGIVSKYGDELRAAGVETSTLNRENQGGANDPRLDPRANTMAMALLTRENQRAIGSRDPANLYLAHFSGSVRTRAKWSQVSTSASIEQGAAEYFVASQ